MADLLIIAVVAIALIFDFVNGFHDAANSIATVVATRVLKPWQAVIWAAFFNFAAFLILPLEVANAIAKIVSSDIVSPAMNPTTASSTPPAMPRTRTTSEMMSNTVATRRAALANCSSVG